MPKKISFVDLESQFDDAMATISSLYELMQSTEVGSDYKHEMFRKIGRGGLSSAKKAEIAFHSLMELYLDEQREIKGYMAEPKIISKDPAVERALSLIERAQIKHTKQ